MCYTARCGTVRVREVWIGCVVGVGGYVWRAVGGGGGGGAGSGYVSEVAKAHDSGYEVRVRYAIA